MLRIRRIFDDVLPVNKEILQQVKEIFRSRFSDVNESEIEQIDEKLRNPFKQRFRTLLLVAETLRGRVQGFAMILHEPVIGFVYLDWIATLRGITSGGLGDALYDRVRREATLLKAQGVFFECLPDDPSRCPDKTLLKDNRARLRFYERYGARPIVNTGYEMPVHPEDDCMPHLVYDGLEAQRPLRRYLARKVVRTVLERKYAHFCPAEYVERVVASISDDPVQLREHRYVKPEAVKVSVDGRFTEQIALVVNDKHTIHHVHERGYVESPVRVRSILRELEKAGFFITIKPRTFPEKHIHAVHDADFATYIRKASGDVPEGKSLYPYVFPIRNKARPPKEPSVLAGYYCIDTFTPIHRNVYPAARRGVDCTLTAAREILSGRRIAYALVRPPGHHAERRAFGGFCYFNNNAVAAQYLCGNGKVAILDIDYHHGNGQQDIFYRRSDVLTVSIHGHPSFAYPYFSGFADEGGEGDGEGFNLNLPLPESVTGEAYRKTLGEAIERHAVGFFKGLAEASLQWGGGRREHKAIHGLKLRYEVKPEDMENIRRLVEITGFFHPAEVDVAAELVSERLRKGSESGYHFILAEHYGRLIGYACYGPIPCTASSYDLYWIIVHPDFQGRGLGRKLLHEAERFIQAAAGARIYVDTSQRAQYASTRAFYEQCGYTRESVLPDFYAPGDGKVIYCKTVV